MSRSYAFFCEKQGLPPLQCAKTHRFSRRMSFIRYLCHMKVRECIAMNTKKLDQLKDKYYGPMGTPERERLENELEALRIGFKIKAAREQNGLTQAEVAKRINKKRTFISKVETDGENITLRSLF